MKITKVSSHCFGGWSNDTELSLNDVTRLAGRNNTGKTTTANAITATLLNCDFWGSKIMPFNNGNVTWVDMEIDGELYRRIWTKKNKTVSSSISKKICLPSKDLVLSILNPKYWPTSSPAKAKEILMSINAQLPAGSFMSPECASTIDELIANAEEFSDDDFDFDCDEDEDDEDDVVRDPSMITTLGNLMSYINNVIDMKTETIKKIDASIIATEGVGSYCQLMKLPYDYEAIIIKQQGLRETAVAEKKLYEGFKRYAEKQVVARFNSKLHGTFIQTEENGKDVFNVLYFDKPWKCLSGSEELQCGLDIVDALSLMSGWELPCILDNVETVDLGKIYIDDYDNIKQFIILGASDCPFGYVLGSNVLEPKTKKVIGRIPDEALLRSVEWIGGWGA